MDNEIEIAVIVEIGRGHALRDPMVVEAPCRRHARERQIAVVPKSHARNFNARKTANALRARDRTGWAPGHTRDEGLQKTIAWFRDPANLARYRPGDYTR